MKSLLLTVSLIFSVFFSGENPDNLKINELQVIGSHNSYKLAIDPELFKLVSKNAKDMAGLDYSHIGLSEQLNLGLRNLEIDVYSDTIGGKYATPLGMKLVKNQPEFDPSQKMKLPGFKVFHVQDIDFRSHNLLLRDDLKELKKWSDAHPAHEPVFITMNAKDDVIEKAGFTVPEKFTARSFDLLEEELKTNLGLNKLITPSGIQGKYSTLEEAVLHFNWPKLKNAKGKFIFILDETGTKRKDFINNHPSLKGRIMFANAEPDTPEAAILIINDPKKDGMKIQEYVKKGYIVRTRADADTRQARENDYSQFEAAKASGAQIITTDYYRKSTHFKSDYEVFFEKGVFVRKNPVIHH